jgi:hypothetical protein
MISLVILLGVISLGWVPAVDAYNDIDDDDDGDDDDDDDDEESHLLYLYILLKL